MAKDPGRPRIFGIGLNKTATSSFHEAMTILGFDSLHFGDGVDSDEPIKKALQDEVPLLSYFDSRYDAFSDMGGLSRRFALLDEQYPGSRFILTVRPVDDWLASRRKHVERNRARHAAGEYRGSFLEVEEDAWRQDWEHHTAGVRAYFAGRDDFLEIDLTAGRGWRPLCDLLGVDEPDAPFPWANRNPLQNEGRSSTGHHTPTAEAARPDLTSPSSRRHRIGRLVSRSLGRGSTRH